MGNLLCCSQSAPAGAKLRILNLKEKNSGRKLKFVIPDTSSTSDSQTEKFSYQQFSKPEKLETFANFISQRNFEISSIKKLSQNSDGCSQQKTFIKYIQRLQKQLPEINEEKDSKAIEELILQNEKNKTSIQQFIEHSSQCPTCYELFQNLKSMELSQPPKVHITENSTRISLRDSLLEFDQCQKAKRCAECKCQVLSSQQEAQKALRKFPNSNKYQSKNIKFRKTSLFEPQIKEQRQSQESY